MARESGGPFDKGPVFDADAGYGVALGVSHVRQHVRVGAGSVKDKGLRDGHLEAVDVDVVGMMAPARLLSVHYKQARWLSYTALQPGCPAGRLVARIPVRLDPLLTS
jgi:hypothetical protein